MTDISFLGGGTLADAFPRARAASDLVEAVRSAHSSQALGLRTDGLTISGDRLSVARSVRFAAEAVAATASSAHATAAVALLDTAENALADIADRLERLAEIAEDGSAADLSHQERARMQQAFDALKDEIDSLAAQASFGDTAVLAGDGGDALRIDFRVGAGNDDADRIEIAIDPASVGELSASLATASLASANHAEDAASAVAEAADAVATIRAGVRGDRVRVGSAWLGAQVSAAASEDARARLADPAAAIDLAAIVADQVAEESDIPLAAGAERHLRRLLSELAPVTSAETAAEESAGWSGAAAEDEPALQPLTVEPAAGEQGSS